MRAARPLRRHSGASPRMTVSTIGATRLYLKRIFGIGRLDRTAPGTVEFIQQLFGRRAPAIDDAIERLEMAGLVAAEMIDAVAPAQTRMREHEAFLGDLEQIAVLDPRLEAKARHLVAQGLAFFRGPVLCDVPGRIEARIIVEQPDPERRQRGQPAPWPAVRPPHFQIALEAHFRENR